MELNTIEEFKDSEELREKLAYFGVVKKFAEGDIILSEDAFIKSIPIVTREASGYCGQTITEGNYCYIILKLAKAASCPF